MIIIVTYIFKNEEIYILLMTRSKVMEQIVKGEEMKFLKIELPEWLHAAFKSKVYGEGKSVKDKVTELMQDYIGNKK